MRPCTQYRANPYYPCPSDHTHTQPILAIFVTIRSYTHSTNHSYLCHNQTIHTLNQSQLSLSQSDHTHTQPITAIFVTIRPYTHSTNPSYSCPLYHAHIKPILTVFVTISPCMHTVQNECLLSLSPSVHMHAHNQSSLSLPPSGHACILNQSSLSVINRPYACTHSTNINMKMLFYVFVFRGNIIQQEI